MTASFDIGAARNALEPLAEMLRLDGYDIEVTTGDGNGLDVRVVAGPDACVECLVPQPVFEAIVRDKLRDRQLSVEPVSVAYP